MVVNEQCDELLYQKIFEIRCKKFRDFLFDFDPHVRIAGRADDVKRAREKIMQVLDTRSNRVTMKIDVSYTDHSHIIGKGGLTIKRVMEDTGCHIHFPDSNRTSATEKSNQVSIAGDMERVERARARVRALTPLVFSFELPIAESIILSAETRSAGAPVRVVVCLRVSACPRLWVLCVGAGDRMRLVKSARGGGDESAPSSVQSNSSYGIFGSACSDMSDCECGAEDYHYATYKSPFCSHSASFSSAVNCGERAPLLPAHHALLSAPAPAPAPAHTTYNSITFSDSLGPGEISGRDIIDTYKRLEKEDKSEPESRQSSLVTM
ncbi:PREDICTED: uncharacterized protein LOC106105087 [Papilio polytes]|uniref:uncharacterized protein LOC106105087 n=1 Tax=Papilio polytes TaxID=76194 RepID=UPI000675F6B4|nr:PREDICTED: uncharacterized protein LOC106105087 [Papilio polytes]